MLRIAARRRAVVTVVVAAGLVAVIGLVALSVDGGMLHLEVRKARAHADASAMAAACMLYKNYPKEQGKDSGAAKAEALAVAAKNGLANDGVNSSITVNIPPASGPYQGVPGYAEVLVTYYVQRGFSRVFSTAPIPLHARAVARGAWISPKVGVLILDYDDKASLNTQGNGAFTETGAPVIVNSNNPSATVAGGNGKLYGSEFYITGGVSVSGNGGLESAPTPGKVYLGTHPTPDPLAYLPAPPVPPDGVMTKVNLGSGNTMYVMTPGRYTNLPNFHKGDVVVLQQASTNGAGGIFYVDGGGFHSTGATVMMGAGTGGVMLYNRPASASNSEKFEISGNPDGKVNLSGLTTGPYTGMVFWQDRTSSVDINITGNGDFSLDGTLYAANARMNLTGNSKTATGDATTGYFYDQDGNKVAGSSKMASQLIVRNLQMSGNGNLRIDYNPQKSARTRVISLVE